MQQSSAPTIRKRRAIILFAALATIVYVSAGFAVDAPRVREAIGELGLLGCSLVLALSVLNYLVRFARWQMFLSRLGHRLLSGSSRYCGNFWRYRRILVMRCSGSSSWDFSLENPLTGLVRASALSSEEFFVEFSEELRGRVNRPSFGPTSLSPLAPRLALVAPASGSGGITSCTSGTLL